MRNFWWLAAVVAVLAASCDGPQEAAASATAEKTVEDRLAEWNAYQYRQIRTVRAQTANFEVDVPVLPHGAEVRFLFHLQPVEDGSSYQDYYALSATRSGIALYKVECGIEMPMARWEPEGWAPFADPQRVTIMRRRGSIDVVVGSRRALHLWDETFTGGLAAIGMRGMPDGVDSQPVARTRYVGEIHARDDFVRTEDEVGAWRTMAGKWHPKFPTNPGLSANSFVFVGKPDDDGPGMTVLGESWWDDYSVEVSVSPVGCSTLGLLFRYVDDDNHYMVRHKGAGDSTLLQLVRVRDSVETVLAEQGVRLATNEWYRIAVEASGRRILVRLDGREFFDVGDHAFSFGRIGLYVADPTGENDEIGAEFDDLVVRGSPDRRDLFENQSLARLVRGGDWQIDPVENHLMATGPQVLDRMPYGKLIGGNDDWKEYTVETTVLPETTGRVGVVGRYRDELSYDFFDLDPQTGECRLVRVRDGQPTVAARAEVELPDGPYRLALASRHGVIAGSLDGRTVVSHFDDSLPGGRIGLLVGRNAEARFDDLTVRFSRPSSTRETFVDAFAHETTMANWASPGSDWNRTAAYIHDERRAVYWHRGDFPGGVGLRVGADFPAQNNAALRIYTCASGEPGNRVRANRGRMAHGYELAVTSSPDDGEAEIALYRNGERVESANLPALRSGHHIALRRVEDYLLAELDDRAVLAYRDTSPLTGHLVGYSIDEVEVDPANIELFADNQLVYSFTRAMVDWRTAGGVWEVTNRWECDPRWSFVCGDNREGVAAMWNKHRIHGDVALEYAVSIRHRRGGSGGYEAFVSDMNSVICGDGESLNSGYGFIYGGWNNSKSAITRNGKVVAETDTAIPISGFHRRWFYVRVVRRGAQLRFYVDGNLLLEYEDPDPLPDTGQVALWTWENGLMVGRVRITADKIGEKEVFTHDLPGESVTIYELAAIEERLEGLLDSIDAAAAKGDLAGAMQLAQAARQDDLLKRVPGLPERIIAVCELLPEVNARPEAWDPAKPDRAIAGALLASAVGNVEMLDAALDVAGGHPLHKHYEQKLHALEQPQHTQVQPTATQPRRPAPDLEGLILHYQFDEKQERVIDSGPNERRAKAVNLGWTAEGKVGGAAVFDGRTSYVDIGRDHDLPQRDNYSISVWFLNDGEGDWGRGYGQKIFDKTIFYHDFYLALRRNGRLTFFTHTLQGGRGTLVDEKERDFRDGKWHHCVIVKEGARGRMYVNGELVGEGTNLQNVEHNGPFLLGYSKSQDHFQRKYWSGKLDEFMVFDRPLSENEVTQLWAWGNAELAELQ